jgi:hypothetical protein
LFPSWHIDPDFAVLTVTLMTVLFTTCFIVFYILFVVGNSWRHLVI